MSNDECLKNDEFLMSKDEREAGGAGSAVTLGRARSLGDSPFVIRHSLGIRHSSFVIFIPLLAQIDKWREMGREFQSDHSKLAPGTVLASLSVLAVVVVFLWLLARLMTRTEERRLFNNPKQLVRSLCRAHQLSRADRRLLAQIGRARRIAQPASLFLDPDQFDAAAELPALRGQKRSIKELRERLFKV